MRRLPILLILLFALAAPAAYPATVGSPSQNLPQWSFSISAGASFALRDIHVKRDEDTGEAAYHSRLAAKVAFSPLKFLDLFGVIGTGDWRMTEPDFEGTLGLLYGGGFRVRFYPFFTQDEGLFNIELGGQVNRLTTRDGNGEEPNWDGRAVDADYFEYEAQITFSKRFEFLVPYGGVEYNYMGVDFSPGGSYNVESDWHWGVFLGLDYFVTPLVFFSAELHVFTETSLYLGVGFAY